MQVPGLNNIAAWTKYAYTSVIVSLSPGWVKPAFRSLNQMMITWGQPLATNYCRLLFLMAWKLLRRVSVSSVVIRKAASVIRPWHAVSLSKEVDRGERGSRHHTTHLSFTMVAAKKCTHRMHPPVHRKGKGTTKIGPKFWPSFFCCSN